MRTVKPDFPFFDGVQLFDVQTYLLLKYSGIHYMGYKLKSCYIDLYDKYAFWWADTLYMPFHDWLAATVIYKLKTFKDSQYTYYRSYKAKDFKSSSDIVYKEHILFECETGLKHKYTDLKRRLYRNPLFTYVIVPNSDIKKKYKLHLKKFHGRVLTLKEFYNIQDL